MIDAINIAKYNPKEMGYCMYPKDLNYKMPAEWTTHERTFISWPVKESMCYPENHESVCLGYAEYIKAISEFEPVTVIVNPKDLTDVTKLFASSNISFLPIDHNDAWLRDNGPTFVVDENYNIAGVNWKFNAWGEKYAPWDLDDMVAPKILEHFNVKKFDAPLVLEGGSIHVDGEGTLLTTEECLLNPNRNPDLTKEQIENYAKQYLNIEKIIWLKNGLDGDETDGHVDNIACFAAPGKIIMQTCDDPNDKNYEITLENLEILKNSTDAKGRKLEVISINQPPRVEYEGERLTLSYLNFYFVNDGIILPIFGGTAKEADKLAENVLSETFPNRRIRTVDGITVIKEGGNVHCTTQQMPLVKTSRANKK
ncbi:agmatine deiminase [Clostridium saccharoperbutylacetonicum]|jgi:agmatine deiminase|uniref:Putative agmatine deiminase n=3 Tax=Clostridiaceae TaxID=31979 RepID=M1ME96_9CLOT|nr:putative agmatine deiminase AguA [Clostridium saccharoperbutylacetonicum N1-4(HMT)]AQR94969.1 agmatine deiminase [Clostridium saccharoperbutylacetonicum]NRT63028.1 agmatine deiminase [Clostridium saccharoperbutylacetonicum]NSB26385.1 agmatine deiminase [Clostridium saccharoperbutylacetonicum]NSB45738.1 agmatine deiminase [Clostridium saccharoperbutylacetonicum]